MRLSVKTLAGGAIDLGDVPPSLSIAAIKALVRDLAGGELEGLEDAGAELDDARTLAECGVSEAGATLLLALRDSAGAALSGPAAEASDGECPVCLSSLQEGDVVALGACGHRVHVECGRGQLAFWLDAFAAAGGAALPASALAVAVAATLKPSPLPPGLLCGFCLPSAEAQREYGRAFSEAALARRLPTMALLAAP